MSPLFTKWLSLSLLRAPLPPAPVFVFSPLRFLQVPTRLFTHPAGPHRRPLARPHTHRYLYDMNIAYFRHHPDSVQVQINFHYVNQTLQLDRVFNLARTVTESIDSCLGRIQTNLEKELLKKKSKKKKKQQGGAEEASLVPNATPLGIVQLTRQGVVVRDRSVLDVLSVASVGLTDLRLEIFGEFFSVAYNLPWVTQITLPTTIMAGYFLYPNKLDLDCCAVKDCDYKWFKAVVAGADVDANAKWQHVGDSFHWLVPTECVGHVIKLVCTPKSCTHTGPSAEAISKCIVTAGPTNCLFESRHEHTKTTLSGSAFRVVTFNMLADLYADQEYTRTVLFPYCPPHALALQYRRPLLIRELLGYNADLMCLQEVDAKVFDYDLRPVFDVQGYEGTFQRKGVTAEGVATFYNSKRFSLIEAFGINIGESLPTLDIFADLWTAIRDNKQLADRITERSTAVQVSVIKSIETDKIICLANTHLYFHPDADHIRLLQYHLALLYVQHVRATILQRIGCSDDMVSVVFAGDFNSSPDCGIYKLTTEKFVPAGFVDFSSNPDEALSNLSLAQPLNMDSAYKNVPFTNYTVGFTECIDYIFYQTDDLRVIKVVPTPSEAQLKENIAIPSVVHPSDHVALIADLEWR